MGAAVLLLIVLAILVFWVYEFIQVMLLADADFPGKHDKILWVAAFIVLPVMAPFAFYAWKAAYLQSKIAERYQRRKEQGEDVGE